jgi:hypothetical protein
MFWLGILVAIFLMFYFLIGVLMFVLAESKASVWRILAWPIVWTIEYIRFRKVLKR